MMKTLHKVYNGRVEVRFDIAIMLNRNGHLVKESHKEVNICLASRLELICQETEVGKDVSWLVFDRPLYAVVEVLSRG